MHLLDRPVWATLTTHHAGLSEGNELARRFMPDVNLFASARDDTPESVAALAALLKGPVYFLQVPDIVVPPGLAEVKAGTCVQMLAAQNLAVEVRRDDIVTLTDEDAPEMLSLARLTEPGPFLPRTHTMGTFLGIRIDGRLAAMAGERMRFPGYTEVSAVCTHPDFRGRGLARRLSAAVMTDIVARGERPFLHAWKGNDAAISLYEKLGFTIRAQVNILVMKPKD